MAVTVVPLLTELSDADTTTGWSGNSGGQDLYTYIEGGGTPASYTWYLPKNSNQTCTFTPATNQNFTTNYTYPHLYFWFQTSIAQFLQVRATSGFRVRLTDGSGNWTEWYMAGSDTWRGEWKCFILDCNNTSDIQATSGTLSLTDIDIVSFYVDSINVGYRNVDNMWNDLLQFGEGLQTYGTAYDLGDIAAVDATEANQYGILQPRDGVLFCQGKLEIGDGTNQTTYSSNGEVLFFLDPTTGGYNGGAVGSVHSSLYVFTAAGNSSNSTFSHTGGVISASGNATYHLDLDATSFQTITFTGNTVSKANLVEFWNSSTSCTVTGNTFDTCGPIYPNGCKFENNVINNTTSATSTGAVYISDSGTVTNMKNVTFNTYSGKYAVYIPATVTGSITFDNWQFDGSGTDVYWAGTAGTLTISKNNGSNPTTSASAGGTISFVGASVTVQVTSQVGSGETVGGARVFLAASDGTGPFPFEEAVTLNATASTTVTATHTAHGMDTGDKIVVYDAADQNANGVFSITKVDDNSYTYTARGTVTLSSDVAAVTFVALEGLVNDVTGILSTTRVYPSNQPVSGWVRKSTRTSVTAGSFVVGKWYTITSVGNTSFTAIGADSNTVGEIFKATGVGSGTGTATETAFKTAPISGSVNSTTGYTGVGTMILDE